MTGSGDAERASRYAIFTRALIHSRDTELSLLDDFDRIPRLVTHNVPVISTLQHVSFRYILHRALRRLTIIFFLLPASEYHFAQHSTSSSFLVGLNRPRALLPITLFIVMRSTRSPHVPVLVGPRIDATCSAAHHT